MTTKVTLEDAWVELVDAGESYQIAVVSTTPMSYRIAASAPSASDEGAPLRGGQWVDRGPAGKVYGKSYIEGQKSIVWVMKDAS